MTGLSDKDRARDEWAAVERATQRRRAQAARSEGQGEPETAADAAVERIWEAHGPEVKSALAGQGEPVAFLANALVMTGLKTEAELIDMANVGQSLLERIALLTQDGPFKGWTPRDDPAEIVFDLVNHYEDAAGTSPPDPQARIEALEKALRDIQAELRGTVPTGLALAIGRSYAALNPQATDQAATKGGDQ